MKTRDKDFTGCHPEIAEALKSGKEVYCNVWYSDAVDRDKAWITDFDNYSDDKYMTTKGDDYTNAEPVKTKSIVKPFYELVEQLKKDGYYLSNPEGGSAVIKDEKEIIYFHIEMFKFCGREFIGLPYTWKNEWLKEVEE